MRFYFSVFLFLSCMSFAMAQSTTDYAVQVSASVETGPAAINLRWPAINFCQGFTVYRKAESDKTWGKPVATLSSTVLGWTDTAVRQGHKYEYKIRSDNQVTPSNTFKSYGYILAGIEAPVTEYRGKVILMLEDTFANSLGMEIDRLVNDMRGDGWVVIKHIVKRTDAVTDIKKIISDDYKADKTNTKALFLLGHIPVPYSGDYAPDGHPNHFGSWPSDSYYGDMTDTWTDTSLIDTVAGFDLRNRNVIGDGKFDQEFVSNVELQIGRVDFIDMPAFAETEIAIMKRYLNKDHDFRMKKNAPQERGFIDDKFGAFGGEAFAASGYKAFAPMFGDKKIGTGNYLDSCKKNSYLFSYACSGGQPNGFINYIFTDSFVTDSLPTVFNMFFGSYFGDWGFQNDFLRAPLASKGWQLTNCWSGRPHWIMHQMALGENIGYCARLSSYDVDLYLRNNLDYMYMPSMKNVVLGKYQGALRNISLMGDPTLRMHIVSPPGAVTITNTSDSAKASSIISLSWAPGGQSVLGYNIYRARNIDSPFVRINNAIVSGTTFTDSTSHHGANYYMVRAVVLQTSASGSYYNMSEGSFSNSTYSYMGINDAHEEDIAFDVFPNPSNGNFSVRMINPYGTKTLVSVSDALGRQVFARQISTSDKFDITLNGMNPGVYFVTLKNEKGISVKKIVVE